ncbi:Helicase domino [Chionoecetes opilio]|uniref:Helicase domino n=1 Tax=Chionoecetes opilio TaxID=41210 RepID=A0A8J5CQJ7_CHIOP|nr:Helicase domino [Chionoecetes opilio]
MSDVLDKTKPAEEQAKEAPDGEHVKMGAFETALAAAEDETDVQAAKTAKAEAAAELAEFDENIPIEEGEGGEELSKAEQEVATLMKQLTPVEKYAMKFLESSDDGWAAEAERMAAEIEQQKKEWELGRLQALKDEEERMAHNSDEDILTYSSADAHNQVNIKKKGREKEKGQVETVGAGKRRVGRPSKSPKAKIVSEDESDDYNSSDEDILAYSSADAPNQVNIKKKGREKGQVETVGAGRRRVGRPSKSPKSPKAKIVSEDESDDYNSSNSDTDLSESEDNMSESDSSSDVTFGVSHKRLKADKDEEMGEEDDESDTPPVSPSKVVFNRVSEDSPRTRSRGRVKINLWTLDVNPVLPGERPVPFSRKQMAKLRTQGLNIPSYEGSSSPSHSEDRSRNNSGQTMNGELEGEGEDVEVDVVGDSGDSSNIDGTVDEVNGRGESLEDVAGSLKAGGPTPIAVHNGVGL